MAFRFTAALVFLLLAGCATTGNGTHDGSQALPEPQLQAPAVPRTAETIDEHLFIPKLEPLPDGDDEEHVHVSAWERLTHRFELPECSDQEINLEWAAKHGEAWDKSDLMGIEFFLSEGGTIIGLDSDEAARWETAVAPVVESYVSDLKKKGFDAEKYVDFIKNSLKE